MREQLDKDGRHSAPAVRSAKVSSIQLEHTRKAGFPHQENHLYDLYRQRRDKRLRVSGRCFRAKMRKLVKDDELDAKFKASPGWLRGFRKRYHVSRRIRTNNKSKSAAERLPQVQRFHRSVKWFCQPPPARDPKYGQFPAKPRAHFEQVPQVRPETHRLRSALIRFISWV